MGRLLSRAIEEAGFDALFERALVGHGLAETDLARLRDADLLLLAAMADAVRERHRGDVVRVMTREAARRADDIECLALVGGGAEGATGQELLLDVARARLRLPASRAVAVDFEQIGLELAQTALAFGADVLLGDLSTRKTLPLLEGPQARRQELTGLCERAGRRVVWAEPGAGGGAGARRPRPERRAEPSAVFSTIAEKVRAGERLDFEDGLALMHEPDLLSLGALANEVRERRHGDRTFFNVNMRFEATNVCQASCSFCAFAKLEEGAPGAHTTTHEAAWKELAEFPDPRLSELHMVNGLHPDLPFEWYEELLLGWKRLRPEVHLKCFTGVEIHFFAEKFGMSHREVLLRLRAAGLDSMPGGGAEILHPDVRCRIATDKADGEQYLAAHRAAHDLGIPTNCTMLYGHIETFEHRVDHLLRLRALQDDTQGFQCFIPLAFHNENNSLQKLPEPTAVDDLRVVAVSRLMLDNIDHIKAYWVSMGVDTAQIALRFGADDVDGTIVHESIYHSAGSRAPMAMTRDGLIRLIREAGRIPVERDTQYRVVEELPKAAAPEASMKVRERNRERRSLAVVAR